MPGEVGTRLALRELHRKPGGLIINQVASPQTRQKQDVLLWHHQRLSLLTVSQMPRASTSHHRDLEPQVPTSQSHEPSQPPNTGHVFKARPTGTVQARDLLRTLQNHRPGPKCLQAALVHSSAIHQAPHEPARVLCHGANNLWDDLGTRSCHSQTAERSGQQRHCASLP